MNPATSPLLTDLYQLNMIQAYPDRGETNNAVFELSFRDLPRDAEVSTVRALANSLTRGQPPSNARPCAGCALSRD